MPTKKTKQLPLREHRRIASSKHYYAHHDNERAKSALRMAELRALRSSEPKLPLSPVSLERKRARDRIASATYRAKNKELILLKSKIRMRNKRLREKPIEKKENGKAVIDPLLLQRNKKRQSMVEAYEEVNSTDDSIHGSSDEHDLPSFATKANNSIEMHIETDSNGWTSNFDGYESD